MFRLNPDGRLPELTDHVIEAVPVASSVALYASLTLPFGSEVVESVGGVPVLEEEPVTV